MIIGIPREIKPEEKRVSLTPDGVEAFVRHGHQVFREQNAGGNCDYSCMIWGHMVSESFLTILPICSVISHFELITKI